MKKNLSVGFAAVLFSFGCVQALSAQVQGKVTRLHPGDHKLLCIHQYEEAVAEGFVENHYDDRAIRGRITVYVIKRESANGLILVDKSTDTQLIDV